LEWIGIAEIMPANNNQWCVHARTLRNYATDMISPKKTWQRCQEQAMKRFRRTFIVWFASLMILFVVLNFPDWHGSKVHRIGFPYPIVEWLEIGDWHSETEFHPSGITVNAALSIGISGLIALVCATARVCSKNEEKRMVSEQ
jgi:hypothetical protein